MTELHVFTGTSIEHQAEAFLIEGDTITAVVDGERHVVVDCTDANSEDGYWVDAEHGAIDGRACFTGPNLSEAHVFVDGKHVAKGARVRLNVGGPEALLTVGGRNIGIFKDGRWSRANQQLEPTKPLGQIVIGPENALELIEQPWRTGLGATPRQRLSPLAV